MSDRDKTVLLAEYLLSKKSNLKLSQIKVAVIIPALNEASSIGHVIDDIPKDMVTEIIVVDNGSEDNTAYIAQQHGATALLQEEKGYGAACLKGIAHLHTTRPDTDIVVFLDGDYSDYPEELTKIIAPIINDKYEMVIGSRALGQKEKGSMTLPQRFGNWLATFLIKIFYKETFTDLGPFRAITFEALQQIEMTDRNYGWTVEMQLKAAKLGLRSCEIPVRYRKRIGKSKVSGTVKGTLLAGYKILWTIFKYS